ncbi:MAG TPA: vWA domain-containing protein [Candidatus Thiothrix moscowensis]|uniref:vWA domain-containing protein n=1 Tax=unclassified Thiothrix TaxID=2636184 RepID=UPI0025ECC8AD|nr:MULTISPECIES: vWA domain-containing protein [unclassified Thiothrix]HRJ53340.1 vWA domain-containing protein [Candidatus Thiothrix moscowensis]HRJ94179.1 vWA domain-containing protein [Candidatus Thiothrix moscowensis]
MKYRITTLTSLTLLATVLAGCGETTDTQNKIESQIHDIVQNVVQPTHNENQYRANIQLTPTNLLAMLPDLAEYPLLIDIKDDATTEVAEIFTSADKAGKGQDGVYLELADKFNQQGQTLDNGKKAAVTIRKLDSGLGAQFIMTGQYIAEGYSPANALWGNLVNSGSNKLTTVAEVTAPSVGGIIARKSKLDQISADGKLDVAKLLTNVSNGSFAMGYTNPYQSATGLNFLITVLDAFAKGDQTQMLSPDVASAFEAFQLGVPFVAQNTLQMRDAAMGSGVLDGFVGSEQTWLSTKGMEDYQFVPFGVRHDNPLYATSEADPAEQEVLKRFAQFVKTQQDVLQKYGFGTSPDYKDAYKIPDGNVIAQAQKLWKQKKSGGKPIAAVFVTDISGSMEGERIKNLKKALIESSDLISANNAIGLVSYSDTVNVDLPISSFNVQQKSLFNGAVEQLSVGGKTATYSATLVAADLLLEFKKTHPDYKTVIFVLSDGETNTGIDFEEAKLLLEQLGVPIHTIAYELSSPALKDMASWAEGAYTESSTGSASFRIGNLLNAEM